jgi:hypothetical protein
MNVLMDANYSMVHRIPLTKARINLGQIVRRTHLNKECFILEKDQIPVAAIIDIGELEDYLELADPAVRAQIRQGFGAYKSGKTKDATAFLSTLRKKHGKQRS